MKLIDLKRALIRSPFEELAKTLQFVFVLPKLIRNPGLKEVYLENQRIEKIVKQRCSNTSNCIDIGAHLGTMLSVFMRYAPNGSHIAIEPSPTRAGWLREKFPEAQIHQIALSDQETETVFYENLRRPAFSSLSMKNMQNDESIHSLAKSRDSDFIEYAVEVKRLDDIVPCGQTIDLLKVDVEGAELGVLKGAVGIIQNFNPLLIFESGPTNASDFGYEHSDLYDYVTGELVYDIYTPKGYLLNDAPLTRGRFDDCHKYPFEAFNFIGVKKT